MRSSINRLVCLVAVAVLGLSAVGAGTLSVRAQDATGTGVETIIGPLNGDLAQEPHGYMIMSDLTGFIHRDFNEPQYAQTIVGWVDQAKGTYEIDLPIHPRATLNNVGNGQGGTQGVEIFSVDSYYDAVHDPRPSPWEYTGWNNGDGSLVTDLQTTEVTGGKIVVWAPDDAEFFPTNFGADGKLFTADDPTGPIPRGWTVVDLDQHPFALDRSPVATISLARNLLDPFDFSQQDPVEAFDSLIGVLKARYPLPTERPVDWDGLRAKFLPEFEAAAQSGDPLDFNLALNHFIIAVGVRDNFTNVPWTDGYRPLFAGSVGIHVDETDDGRVIIIKVDAGLPAEQAGIAAGAELLTWNGVNAEAAIDAIPQIFATSSPQVSRSWKRSLLGRVPTGTAVSFTYRNPSAGDVTAITLTAVENPRGPENDSYCFRATAECYYQTPLTVKHLPGDIWVIRIRIFGSDAQDVRLIGDAWDRAIGAIGGSGGKGIILDVRGAGPQIWYALPMYMAGSFFSDTIPVADVTSVDANGQSFYQGTLYERPNPAAWTGPVAVVVDSGCEGNCELFIQAMTHLPNLIIAGMEPTAGAVVTGYQSVLLPDDCFVNFVDHALRDPVTHQPIIEGTGFAPTVRVPRTPENLVAAADGDPVMDAAAKALADQVANPPATPTS